MKFSPILLFIILIAVSCTDECIKDNIKLGDIPFNEETLKYLDYYNERESIQFSDENGNTQTYQIELQESEDPRLCVKVICRPSYEVGAANGCEYYDTEDRHYILSHDDLLLHLRAGVKIYTPETDEFYDFVEIGLNYVTDSISAGLISASNFSLQYIDTTSTILTEQLMYTDTSTLINQENVWVYHKVDEEEEEEIFLILDQQKGIIKYKYDDKVWTLIE